MLTLVPHDFFPFFRESGFAFTRLDGSMTQKKRVEAIKQFQSKETGSPTIMLLSLKAGGVGLNLTAASRVFLMDPVSIRCVLHKCSTNAVKCIPDK